ncbi:calmodulin-lysine N-methyltransferase [Contarinia nasturtii]|uniref:calmodulin-lysine N-methyltransferase n=1 Tax=Contarinia nasturtii TaxID=265458 RepID=UPI0012D45392|nr:calmodulin-lysine N-methyltransferase [Contarinia nasturtii]XP_031624138.1 calmodulin-lysine N-methyltransferase [Contarinia nasturtii]XP_031624139.1 calmodulin-lysine N-methyltransferase [Contarinia nasturtii]
MSDNPTENDFTTKATMTKMHDESHKNNANKTPKQLVTSIAKRRWKILAKALCNRPNSSSFDEFDAENNLPATNQTNLTTSDDYLASSVRRFTCFRLFQRNPCIIQDDIDNENWFVYQTTVDDREYSVVVHELCQKFTPENLIGYNNTGNICIWPSEEALAYHVLHHLSAFHQLRVLELGGGMTCLAGLFIAKYTQANFVHLTDGNDLSIQNANRMLAQNTANNSTTKIMCSVLKWENIENVHDDAQYDCIISADCLFFDSARSSFINALWLFMRPTGIALVMAPCRGDTLNIFLQEAAQKGFNCHVRKCYNRTIWQKHLELLDTNVYDENIHYPILIEVRKQSKQHRVSIIPFT